MSLNPQNQWAAIAVLLRPQGRRGELLADPLTDLPELFASGRSVWLASAVADAPADGVTPLEAIVERKVCADYHVDRTVALKDAEEFVQDLASDGILIVSDQPIATSAHGNKTGLNQSAQSIEARPEERP